MEKEQLLLALPIKEQVQPGGSQTEQQSYANHQRTGVES
jgi:hypothetical protein